MGRRRTFDWDEARKLWVAGADTGAIAARFGVTSAAIRYACRDLPPRSVVPEARIERKVNVGGTTFYARMSRDWQRRKVAIGRSQDGYTMQHAIDDLPHVVAAIQKGTLPRPVRKVGYVHKERKRHGTLYAVRIKRFGRRYWITLGRAEDGWTDTRAEAARRRITREFNGGYPWRSTKDVEPLVFSASKCAKTAEIVSSFIESFERRTGKEAPPQLYFLRESALRLSAQAAV